MLISEKVIEKVFKGKTVKDAYMNCCKWLSTNVIAVNNSNNITYKIEKIKTKEYGGTVKLTLYITTDEEEICERNCNICKEVTGSFFMKQNKYMCEVCKVNPYRKRMKDKLDLIKEGLKGNIL